MNRYKTIRRTETEDGVPYIQNPVYPDIPETSEDIYLITTAGDRYDILAQQFYGNTDYWWIIAAANNSTRDSLYIEPGVQIRVPQPRNRVLTIYDRENKNR
jgi:hypothetical protein